MKKAWAIYVYRGNSVIDEFTFFGTEVEVREFCKDYGTGLVAEYA